MALGEYPVVNLAEARERSETKPLPEKMSREFCRGRSLIAERIEQRLLTGDVCLVRWPAHELAFFISSPSFGDRHGDIF
jgi:hypothetical protein